LQSIECIVIFAPLAQRRSNYAFAACRKSRLAFVRLQLGININSRGKYIL